MKQVGKSVVIVVAMLCVLLFFVGFFGISTAYGDVTTDIINGVHLVPRGFGFEKRLSIFLTANREEGDTTAIDYDRIQRIYEKRLEMSSVVEYEVFVDTESEGVFIKMPYDVVMQTNITALARTLAKSGKFELREGREVDDAGIPTGVTENVILSNEHINLVNPLIYTTSESGAIYYLEINLTGEGQRILREKLAELNALGGDEQYLSCWIDGSMEDYYTASALAETEKLTSFSASSTGYTLNEVTETAIALNSGYLGRAFSLQKSLLDAKSGFAGDNNYMLMVCSMAGALLVVGVMLFLRYRLFGAVSFAAILGCFGLMFFVLTSFYNYAANRQITMASFASFLVILILSFSVIVREAEAMRESKKNTFHRAVNDGFSKNIQNSLITFGMVFLLGLLTMDIFRRTGGWVTAIVRWILPSYDPENYMILGQFGTMLWVGAVFGVLTVVFANRLMTKSLLCFRHVDKTSFFGGRADEEL